MVLPVALRTPHRRGGIPIAGSRRPQRIRTTAGSPAIVRIERLTPLSDRSAKATVSPSRCGLLGRSRIRGHLRAPRSVRSRGQAPGSRPGARSAGRVSFDSSVPGASVPAEPLSPRLGFPSVVRPSSLVAPSSGCPGTSSTFSADLSVLSGTVGLPLNALPSVVCARSHRRRCSTSTRQGWRWADWFRIRPR